MAILLAVLFKGAHSEPRFAQNFQAQRTFLSGQEALDYAFRFASAIRSDPNDQSQSQEFVVLDYAALGAFNEAVTRAGEIQNWRRGTAYAQLAVMLAREGRKSEARALIDKAELVRATVTDWQNPRISSYVAQALAFIGDSEQARSIAAEVLAGDSQQYSGQSVATLAVSQGSKGDFAEAMKTLSATVNEQDSVEVWWRTMGYLDLARITALPNAHRVSALEAARGSANGISSWERAESLELIAEEARLLGLPKLTREALTVAESIALAMPATMPVKSQVLSNLAQAWVKAGEPGRARVLLKKAEVESPSTMNIEQPALLGNVAASYLLLGDEKNGLRLLDAAFTAAEGLVNARPRAIAAVEICRSLGRARLNVTPAMRTRLNGLLLGLKDPW